MRKINPIAVMILVVIIAVAGFVAGVLVGVNYAQTPLVQTIKETIKPSALVVVKSGFVPAEINIVGSTVSLSHSCYRISFDVTDDQAFSIQRGLSKETATRPLTHDILRDILSEFNITVLQMRIERFADDIYYARMFIQQNGNVLDLDMRPSDVIALSLRTGDTLYINQTMLQEKGQYTC